MPGRKQPKEHDEDRRREYRLQQKRSYGEESVDDTVPDLAKLPQPGASVERERQEYAERKERQSRQGSGPRTARD